MKDKPDRDSLVGFLGNDIEVDGKISFKGVLRVDGTVKGKIRSKSSLVVGESGQIEGDINVSHVTISGKVTGTIKAHEKLELFSNAKVFADVTTSCLKIEEGAVFQGNCIMESAKHEESQEKKPIDFSALVQKK